MNCKIVFLIMFFSLVTISCTSKLVVHTKPDGAKIFVNDKYIGKTPLAYKGFTRKLKIKAELEGYKTKFKTVKPDFNPFTKLPAFPSYTTIILEKKGDTKETPISFSENIFYPVSSMKTEIIFSDLFKKLISHIDINLSNKKPSIVVLDFTYAEEGFSNFAKYATDETFKNIFNSKKFKLVERDKLDNALKELKLQMTGLVDLNYIGKIGKMISADYMLTGSISGIKNFINISSRIILIESSEVVSVANYKFER